MAKKNKVITPNYFIGGYKNQYKHDKTLHVGDLSKEAFLGYGSYINNHRHMCNILDGMKDSYRRLVWASLQVPESKKDETTESLVASVARWHPHGTSSLELTAANFVRCGVFSGKGNFGMTSITGTVLPPAAGRYTKCGLSPEWRDLIGELVKEVPMVESPKGPLEPEYIPLPLPLSLFLPEQVMGIGVGIRSVYPNFSAKSLYEAYINDNPMLLKPSIDINLDYEKSELEKIWRTGKGNVIYYYTIKRQKSPDGKTEGILFSGDTGLFTPDIKPFQKLAEEGKVFIEDLTDINGTKLFIGRIPSARITIDEIEKIAQKVCWNKSSCNVEINVTNGTAAFRIPLRDWIDVTYKNYISLVDKVRYKRIDKTLFDISVLEALPIIANYLINENPKASNKEIMEATGYPQEVISEVMSKPLSYLRSNKDNTARIATLKKRVKELKSLDPVKYTEDLISKL